MVTLHMALPATFSNFEKLAADSPFGHGYLFTGHGAAWARDQAGNELQKGCFLPSIEARVPNRMVKVRWMHENPMGYVVEAHEDDIGLALKAFVPQTNTNDEYIQLMQAGVVDKLSIGFDPDMNSVKTTDTGRTIGALTLYEVSPVDLPLNEATGIDQIIKMHNEIVQSKYYSIPYNKFIGATLNAANMTLLRQAANNINTVLDSADKKDSETKDNKDQKDNSDKSKDSKTKEDNENEVDEQFANVDWSDTFVKMNELLGATV